MDINKELQANLEIIKELKKNTNMKYKDIAETLEVDKCTLSRWIKGKHVPTQVYHKKIAEIADFYKKIKVDKKL